MPIDRRDLARLILAATCWGVGTVISKAALAEFPPLTLLAVQLGSSLVVLALLLRAQRSPLLAGAPPRLSRLGLLNPGIAYALSLLGLVTITASLSVMLWALEPLLIVALAAVVLRERITPAFVILSLVAVAGMVVVLWDPGATGGELIGVALTVAGVVCCAIYSVLTRKFIPDAKETGQVAFSQQAYALGLALVLVVGVIVLVGSPVPATLTPLGLASAIGSGVLYYAGAYWFYLGALRHTPASLAAVSFYLIPVVGLAASAMILGERLAPHQWLGALVVLGSILSIFWLGRRPAESSSRVSATNRSTVPESDVR
jgi:probable blue pigment (indigoidine) exporter